ncbi:MAG: helix-turn-helix domain-containing protein [Clostridia bacterium]
MKSVNNRFGILLRELRENNGLTQEFVAEKLHLTRSAYSYYESGTTEPSMKSILILSKIFNVSPEYLLTQESSAAYFSDSLPNQVSISVNKKTPASMTELKDDEKKFIVLYRLASARDKRRVLNELEKSEKMQIEKLK